MPPWRFIDLLEDDGKRGYGEATTNNYYGFTFEAMAAALESVREELKTLSADDPTQLWQTLHPRLRNHPFAQ